MLFSNENVISTAPKLVNIHYLNAEKGKYSSDYVLSYAWQLSKQLMEKHCKSGSVSEVFMPKRQVLFHLPWSSWTGGPAQFLMYAFKTVVPPLLVPWIQGTTKHRDNLYEDTDTATRSCSFWYCGFLLVCELPALTLLQRGFALNSDFTTTSSK